jgi:hypothetical protein
MVIPPTAWSIIIDENIPMDSKLLLLADSDIALFEGRTFHFLQDYDNYVLFIADSPTNPFNFQFNR